MSLLVTVEDGNWSKVRRNFQRLGGPLLGPGAEPTFANVTITDLTASEFVMTDASKGLVSLAVPILVNKGGTGLVTITNHGLMLGSGTDAVTVLAEATDGQLPIGSTGVNPVLATLTAGAGIGVANAAGSITVSCTITQYTDEMAQDAVGGILDDGTVGSIVFTYDDAGGVISAVTQDGEIDHDSLLNVHQDVNTDASPTFAGATVGSVAIPGVYTATREPTGFVDRGAILSFDNGTNTFTITGNHDIYINGVKYSLTTDSVAVTEVTTGLYWIYYNAARVLTASTDHPGFRLPFVATVYWNTTTNKGLLGEERHGIQMDAATHRLLHYTVGSRYESGLAGTFDATTLTIETGKWHDEDIEFEPAQQTTCNVLYHNGDANFVWDAGASVYYKLNGANLRYNNGNALADCDNNKYMAMWIFVTNDETTPIVALMGQRQDALIANARANNKYESLTLGTLPFQEMKLLYRVILRNTGAPPTWVETQDLRNITNVPSGTYVATAHNALTGLTTGDDHTQYALLAGRLGGQTLYGSDTTAEDLTLGDNSVDGNTITVTQLREAYGWGDHAGLYQAVDATLTSIALLGTAAGKILYTTDVDTWAETSITAYGRALIDDATQADMRNTLQLGTGDHPQFDGLGLGEAGVLGQIQVTSAVNSIQRIDFENTSAGNVARAGFIARADAAQWVMDAFGSGHATDPNEVRLTGISSTEFLIWARRIGDAGDYPYMKLLAGSSDITINPTTTLITVTGAELCLSNFHELRFYDDGANYVGFEAPALIANKIWVLPSADGGASELLQTDGAGNLSWTATAPPGAHTHDGDTLQLDAINSDAGSFAFDTGGLVTFNSGVTLGVGADLTINGHILFTTNNSYIGFTDGSLTFNDTNHTILVAGTLLLPDSGYLGCASDTTALQILPAGDIVLTDSLYTNAGLYILERDATVGAVATWGHIWVKNDDPNTLWFTDDDGTDFQLGTSTGSGSASPCSPIYWNMLTKVPDAIGQGTWVPRITPSPLYNGYFWNTTSANGDNFTVNFRCIAGTYSFTFNFALGTNVGILDVYVDDVEEGSFDGYAAADFINIETITGLTLDAGAHTIKFQVDGKNGSSADYYALLNGMCLEQTA